MSETIMSKALGILCDRCEIMSADCAHYPCELYVEMEQLLSAQPEIVRCKDCKHWKDSDGVYRRGTDAESKCPLNTKEVYVGTFYCGYAKRRIDE